MVNQNDEKIFKLIENLIEGDTIFCSFHSGIQIRCNYFVYLVWNKQADCISIISESFKEYSKLLSPRLLETKVGRRIIAMNFNHAHKETKKIWHDRYNIEEVW